MTLVGKLIGTSAAALGALALAAAPSAPAATSPGTIVAGIGCSVSCIETAVVEPTTTTAVLTVKTPIDTKITLSVTKGSTAGGITTGGQQPEHLPSSAYRRHHGFVIWQLEPATTYRIVVRASDRQEKSSTREGHFETLPVKTTDAGKGPGAIASNVGCSVQCITHALFTQSKPAASIAAAEMRTTTAAKIQLLVFSDDAFIDVVSDLRSPGYVTSWKTSVGGLASGTKYYAEVRATDAQGHTSVRQGSFRTVRRTAVVTFAKIKVISDADKGWAAGEVMFSLRAGGKLYSEGGFRKVDSGDVISVRGYGTSRPGRSFSVAANGSAKLELAVLGFECDNALLMKNCIVEGHLERTLDWGGGSYGEDDYAWAGGSFDVDALLAGDALPPGYGIPGGHDTYVTFETAAHQLKFRVYAYIDVHYEWPA
jgi:hypothetical protein